MINSNYKHINTFKKIYLKKNILIYFFIINYLFKLMINNNNIIFLKNITPKYKNIFQFYITLKLMLNFYIYNVNSYIFLINYIAINNLWNCFFIKNNELKKKINKKKNRRKKKVNKKINKENNFFFILKDYINLNNNINFNIEFLEKKKIFIYINLLFFEKNDLDLFFIFSYLNLFENFNYIFTYFNSYKLSKIITNELNINKWLNLFELSNYYYNKYLYKTNIYKTNLICINYLPLNNDYYLDKYFLTYQLRSVFWLINVILINLFNKILKKKQFSININKYDFNEFNLIKKNILDNYYNYSYNYINELVNIIASLMYYKDSQIFIKWIKYNMSILFYKKQNNFIDLIKMIFIDIFNECAKDVNFLGYKITFKGKLNKLGNVRKKKIIISQGITTLSNINYKSDFISDVIITSTGLISIKIIINYI